MAREEVYKKLAEHLSRLPMGYPYRDDLEEILEENFSPDEAEIALAIPTDTIPLRAIPVEEILEHAECTKEALCIILERLSQQGMIYSGKTEDGEKGYALHQVGFGFPQTFFWKGEDTPQAQKMSELVAKYFNRKVTMESFSPTETKAYRYIPVGQSLDTSKQGVYPQHMMERVVLQAEIIALGHCPCRMAFKLRGFGCDHPTEVCIKFNQMARYVIDKGLAKEITTDQALDIIKKTEEMGLVHFVDNAEGDILHNCNCCGCACWNVGNIRRRKIPRDAIMATYFTRMTHDDDCAGCGECVGICPVNAVEMKDDIPVVDEAWCIGCGVCATVCATDAIEMILRSDKTGQLPAATVSELHQKIMKEKGLK